MGFTQPGTLTLPASTQVKIAMFRQACYPFWGVRSTPSTGYAVKYNAEDIFGTVTFSATMLTGTAPVATYTGTVAPATNSLGFAGLYSETTMPPLGFDSGTGRTYVYVPAGWNFRCVIAGPVALQTEAATARVLSWKSPGEDSMDYTCQATVGIGNTGGPTGSFTSSSGLWVSPLDVNVSCASALPQGSWRVYIVVYASTTAYTPSATSDGVETLGPATTRPFLPLVDPVEFYNSMLPWYATRCTAASLLGTNVSQVINKGGTVLAGRISPNVMSCWGVTSEYVSALHPAEKAYLPLETGIYTFVPPSTDLGKFSDHTSTPLTRYNNTAAFAANAPLFRLDNDALYHVMFLTASGVDESLATTVDWHLEFRTSSALFQIGLSTMTLETLHQAQISLAEVGYFFENINHKALLGKVVAAAKKYGPIVGPVVARASPQAASVMAAVGAAQRLLSNRPRQPPAASSAAASGLVPRKPAKAARPARKKETRPRGRK